MKPKRLSKDGLFHGQMPYQWKQRRVLHGQRAYTPEKGILRRDYQRQIRWDSRKAALLRGAVQQLKMSSPLYPMTVSLAGGTRIRIYLSMILMTMNGINSWFDLITSRHVTPFLFRSFLRENGLRRVFQTAFSSRGRLVFVRYTVPYNVSMLWLRSWSCNGSHILW